MNSYARTLGTRFVVGDHIRAKDRNAHDAAVLYVVEQIIIAHALFYKLIGRGTAPLTLPVVDAHERYELTTPSEPRVVSNRPVNVTDRFDDGGPELVWSNGGLLEHHPNDRPAGFLKLWSDGNVTWHPHSNSEAQ